MDIYTIENGYLRYSTHFLQGCMSKAMGDPTLEVISAKFECKVGVTETTEMKYSGETKKIIGIDKYIIQFISKGMKNTVPVLINSKTHYKDLISRLAQVLIEAGVPLSSMQLTNYLAKTALFNTNLKDINIFRLALSNDKLAAFLPKVYGYYVNDEKQEYIVIEEFLTDAYVIQDYTDIIFWNKKNIEAAIKDLALFHSIWYDHYADLVKEGWLGSVMSTKQMVDMSPLWNAYAEQLKVYVGNLFTEQSYQDHLNIVDTVANWWLNLDRMKKTLIYDDIQIRNLAMRHDNQKIRLVLFDWEVPEIHVPQRDLIELLSYVLSKNVSTEEIGNYIELNRITLEKASGLAIDKTEWLAGCLYAMHDYQIDRLACQLMLNRIIKRPDIERVYYSSQKILAYLRLKVGIKN